MSNRKTFRYNAVAETSKFTSHAVYTNGELKIYNAFDTLGKKSQYLSGLYPNPYGKRTIRRLSG